MFRTASSLCIRFTRLLRPWCRAWAARTNGKLLLRFFIGPRKTRLPPPYPLCFERVRRKHFSEEPIGLPSGIFRCLRFSDSRCISIRFLLLDTCAYDLVEARIIDTRKHIGEPRFRAGQISKMGAKERGDCPAPTLPQMTAFGGVAQPIARTAAPRDLTHPVRPS